MKFSFSIQSELVCFSLVFNCVKMFHFSLVVLVSVLVFEDLRSLDNMTIQTLGRQLTHSHVDTLV